MSLRHVRRAGLALLLVGLAAYAGADDLSGRILDPQGNAVPNAAVRLYGRTGGDVWEATSGPDGAYRFRGLAAGDYIIDAAGRDAALSGSTRVTLAGDVTFDVRLAVSPIQSEVVVTASSTPLELDEVAKAIDVVDAEDLDRRGELSVTEAVRTVPGVRVRALRGPGSQTTIQIRGMRNQDTAVLIDGMRFRDAASPQGDATGFLGTMALVNTEQIEILRGSGSSLYGSNAMGGVINITSARGGGRPAGDVRVEGGGLGLARTVASIGGGVADDRVTYSGALSYLDVRNGVRDGSPYRNVSPQGALRVQVTPALSITGRVWYSDDELATAESPAFPAEVVANFPATGPVRAVGLPADQLTRFEQGLPFEAGAATFVPDQIDPDQQRRSSFLNTMLTVQQTLAGGATWRVGYQRVDTDRVFVDGPLGHGAFEPAAEDRSRFNGTIDLVQGRFDAGFGGVSFFTAGYELERETYRNEFFIDASGNTASLDSDTVSQAVFAQNRFELFGGRLHVTLGGRTQRFSLGDPVFEGGRNPYDGLVGDTPTAYTGDLAVAYIVTGSRTKARAHVGNSYRAPSLFERLGASFSSFGGYSYWGDPGLEPERSVSIDGGIDQWLFESRVQLSGTVFYTDLDETIIFDFTPSFFLDDPFGRFGGYRNAGGGRTRGVELSARMSPAAATTVQASYTFTDAESTTPTVGTDFFETLGVSRHLASVSVTQQLARLGIAFDLFAASDYSLSPFGALGRRVVFDGPIKADLAVNYDLPVGGPRVVVLYARVENLFDRLYHENGFLSPGAWGVAGVRFRY